MHRSARIRQGEEQERVWRRGTGLERGRAGEGLGRRSPAAGLSVTRLTEPIASRSGSDREVGRPQQRGRTCTRGDNRRAVRAGTVCGSSHPGRSTSRDNRSAVSWSSSRPPRSTAPGKDRAVTSCGSNHQGNRGTVGKGPSMAGRTRNSRAPLLRRVHRNTGRPGVATLQARTPCGLFVGQVSNLPSPTAGWKPAPRCRDSSPISDSLEGLDGGKQSVSRGRGRHHLWRHHAVVR